jgi:hypothetical protein
MLVFPSELNADLPDYPGGYSLAVVFQFEGPVSGIYATLAVSLINSTPFKKRELYKNAALFIGPQAASAALRLSNQIGPTTLLVA